MDWSLPWLWKDDKDTRRAWGYSFQWTDEHLTREQMHPLKFSCDVLAEECLNRLDYISPPQSTELPRNTRRKIGKEQSKENPGSSSTRDLYTLLRDHSSEDDKLGELWTQVNTIPEWVNWDQISRGQQVFYRYGGAALTALAFQSLLGGMGANRVVETLARTGGFGVQVARHRMYETTQHILQVTNSIASIKPGGAGHISTIRVRFLHAAVRRRILKLSAERPEYFNVEKLGVPINDLDSIATIVSFSASLIWVGFPRQGIWLTKQEIVDYIALWRLVAYWVGCPHHAFENPLKARSFMESLLLFEINPSKTSQALAKNIILSLAGRPPAYASKHFLDASARWLNGNDLADALDIGRPGLFYSALVAGQCIFFMCFCYTYRSIPSLDARKIKALRRIFYSVIVENKTSGLGKESTFEFKYIPDFHTSTAQGEVEDRLHWNQSGVERRNLNTLLVVLGIFSVIFGCLLHIIRVFVGQ